MTDLLDLLAYHRWATARVLNAAQVLSIEDFARDLGSSHGGVRGTLAHLLGADAIWLARLRGEASPPFPAPEQFPDVTSLREAWLPVLDAFPVSLAADSPDAGLRYHNLRGDAFQNTVAQIVRHVVNHGAYHRGQVVTMLRQLGAGAPNTDLIAFYREQKS